VSEPYLETLQLLRRAHRALLAVVDDALNRAGISNINATQALLLHGIADMSLRVGELTSAGHFCGTNAHYNLNKLIALGLIERRRSKGDRREVHIRLTLQGVKIRNLVDALFSRHGTTLAQLGDVNPEEFAVIKRSLRRLDRFWTDQIRYRL
jgi:DNA-binding MarR family transcriptional regulator